MLADHDSVAVVGHRKCLAKPTASRQLPEVSDPSAISMLLRSPDEMLGMWERCGQHVADTGVL